MYCIILLGPKLPGFPRLRTKRGRGLRSCRLSSPVRRTFGRSRAQRGQFPDSCRAAGRTGAGCRAAARSAVGLSSSRWIWASAHYAAGKRRRKRAAEFGERAGVTIFEVTTFHSPQHSLPGCGISRAGSLCYVARPSRLWHFTGWKLCYGCHKIWSRPTAPMRDVFTRRCLQRSVPR
jgi:hypothetical protein